MTEKDGFGERAKALEEGYFRKQEEELIRKMKARAERRELAEVSGIQDDELLADLQNLGFTPETITLAPFMPLLQVAWADGSMSAAERETLVRIAETHGITDGTPAHAKFMESLEARPSPKMFEDGLRVVKLLMAAAKDDPRWIKPTDFASFCTQVAEASGGFLGFAKISAEERALLERIANELENNHSDAARNVLDEQG